jgi:Uncharacterised protein family (UPF0236)
LIEVSESIWRSAEKSYVRVLPESLQVRCRSCSLALQRVLCDFGMEESFAKSVRRLKEHYGFELSPSAVAKATLGHASEIAAEREENPHALPKEGVEQIIAEADGSFLRIVNFDESAKDGKAAESGKDAEYDARKHRQVDYREVRLCAATAQGSSEVYYAATFDEVDTVSDWWAQSAKAAGMGLKSKVHVVSDGAVWIRTQAENAFGEQTGVLLDFYHVCEYLSEASQSVDCLPKGWFETQKKRLLEGDLKGLFKELYSHLEPEAMSDAEAPVRRAYRYLQNRLDALDYKKALEQNLPIGSGLIESGHKHVLQARMKIPGAAWKMENAENMVRARAFRANNKWDQYWDKKAA